MTDDTARSVADGDARVPMAPNPVRRVPAPMTENVLIVALAGAMTLTVYLAPTPVRLAGAVAVAAMAASVLLGRDGMSRRNVVTATGIAVLTLSDAGLVDAADATTMWRPVVALVAYPLLGRSLLRMVGRYRLFRPTDVIVEAVLVGVAAAIASQLGIQWWARTHELQLAALDPLWSALPSLLVGLDVALLVVIARSLTASTVRRSSVVVVVTATALLTIGHAAAAMTLTTGAGSGPVAAGLIAIALVAMGVGTLQAALSSEPAVVPIEVPLFSSGHAGIVVVAVVASPAVVCVQVVYGLTVSGAVAVGTALIGVVLGSYVVALLHERADSEHQATHDVLTGLPNRLLFTDRLERATAHASRNGGSVGVLYIDLDRFKDVNDTLGHDGGDQLLRQTAKRLRGCARHEDTVARLAGDEFAVLLPHLANSDDITIVAERILNALREPVAVGQHTIRNAGSIGVAVYPEDGRSPTDLLNAADSAMYRAKEHGGSGIAMFSVERHQHATTRLELETALHHGIENGELVLHYQPIVNGSDGRICGAEALVRWNHPERGMIPPADFIPVAEQSDLIIKLGNWVIAEACHEQARWTTFGCGDRFVTVNVSSRHFRTDLVSSVTAALRASGTDPNRLIVELTESAAVDDVEVVADRLRELRQLGVKSAIDDFGTGYCGLQYLGDLPVSTLKLDQSFVQAMTPRSAAIVAATIAMARSLGLVLVAEGVETAEQRRFLERHGCDRLQGFHLGRPMPADDFVDRMRAEDRPSPASREPQLAAAGSVPEPAKS